MHWANNGLRIKRRRAAAAALVLITLFVLLASAAFSVDIGMISNARADLQRAADAGAMAAAKVLGDVTTGVEPIAAAREAAQRIVESNPVLGHRVTIDVDEDITFGRANYDARVNSYNFADTEHLPDAVRVRVRMTDGSPNDSLKLVFAPLLGKNRTDVIASATAAVAPRDIAVAADVSGSMVFDSTFSRYRTVRINLWDVWDHFPGGADGEDSTWEPDEIPDDPLQSAGPAWGFFKTLGYGQFTSEPSYYHGRDPGLIYLPPGNPWRRADLADYLAGVGYSGNEVNVVLNPPSDSNYSNQVAVALGLAYWNSGVGGGQWVARGVPSEMTGDGDAVIESSELEWVEPIFGKTLEASRDIWRDYITYSQRGSFRYLFGVKTFMDYILDQRQAPDQTPELADAPVQPLQAIKDAVGLMTDLLDDLESNDLMSLESYSTYGFHEVNLTNEFQSVSDYLTGMNPSHHGPYTNITEGIQRGIEELSSERSRPGARKVLVLLTDGHANRGGGRDGAIRQARIAADLGIQIFSVSVGYNSDQALMQYLAEIGHGLHFHAEGSIDEYSEQLVEIFSQIGGQRPVELIE